MSAGRASHEGGLLHTAEDSRRANANPSPPVDITRAPGETLTISRLTPISKKVHKTYIALQYSKPLGIFNPYVNLVHGTDYLDMPGS